MYLTPALSLKGCHLWVEGSWGVLVLAVGCLVGHSWYPPKKTGKKTQIGRVGRFSQNFEGKAKITTQNCPLLEIVKFFSDLRCEIFGPAGLCRPRERKKRN